MTLCAEGTCSQCDRNRAKQRAEDNPKSLTRCYYCGASVGNPPRCPEEKKQHRVDCPERK